MRESRQRHIFSRLRAAVAHLYMDAARDQTRRRNAARVGTVHEVLVERPARRGGMMLARTRTNHLVLLDLPASAIGSYHTVRLTGTTGSTFTGARATAGLATL